MSLDHSSEVPEQTPLAAALAYAASGWPVFPLAPGTKKPAISKEDGGNGFYDAVVDPEQIRRWWTRWPRANIGMPTGTRSGVVVIDEDPRNGGDAAALYLPDTRMAHSPRDGRHFYFQHPAGGGPLPKDNTGKIATGIDVLADGAYVLLPPSRLADERRYTWLDSTAPLANLPEWVALLLRREEPESLLPALPTANGHAPHRAGGANGNIRRWLDTALARTGVGSGDAWGYWLAQQVLANHQTDFHEQLIEYATGATQDPNDPFTERDVRRWITSARGSELVKRNEPARSRSAPPASPPPIRASATTVAVIARQQNQDASLPSSPPSSSSSGPDAPGDHALAKEPRRRYPYTEMGNSERLIDAYGANLRYCKALGWCAWTGTHWRAGADLSAQRWAKMAIRGMYAEAAALSAEAAGCEDDELREQTAAEADKLQEWARKSERAHMVAAMCTLARDACEIEPDRFDANPWLFNCANGTIDLRTGDLHPHRREDYLMKRSPTAFDPEAEAPRFAKFLAEIMLERAHLVDYLQRIFGYSLTGEIREQEWYLLVGGGENGKSTLVELLADILGDYAGIQEPDSVTVSGAARNAAAPSPDIAALKGKRLVAMTETEEGMRLATARIKRLTGGDKLTGRYLHQDELTFRPEFKLFMYTNHVPTARETTHAFWRRVRYIPFELDLKSHPERKDATLPARLREEAPGILRWLVDGCLGWQRDGMQTPAEVTAATDAYQNEQDTIGAFISDACALGPERCATLPELYEAYKTWCEQGGERALTKRKFTLAIEAHGVDQGRTKATRMWIGIGLASGDASAGSLTTERR